MFRPQIPQKKNDKWLSGISSHNNFVSEGRPEGSWKGRYVKIKGAILSPLIVEVDRPSTLSVPKTLRSQKRRNAAISNRTPQNRSNFLFLKVCAPLTCLCCFTGKKHCDFGICNFETQRFAISFRDFSAIILRNLRWELRFGICNLKTERVRLQFWDAKLVQVFPTPPNLSTPEGWSPRAY